jgi:kinetochore protein NNF1
MLEGRLQESQQENQTLMEKIHGQRAEMETLVKGIESVVADLEGSVQAMAGEVAGGVDALRAETWEMENEVQEAGGHKSSRDERS